MNGTAPTGRAVTFSLDEDQAEDRFRHEPHTDDDAERAYDRQWARAILEQVLNRLREEAEAEGQGARFERLSGALLGNAESLPYAQIAAELKMSEGGVKSAVRRMRQRCGELFRAEIATTVATVEEIDDEIRYLLSLLAG